MSQTPPSLPESAPSRGKLHFWVVLLGVLGALCVAVIRTNTIWWLQGRTNGAVSGAVLLAALGLCGIGCLVAFFACVAFKICRGNFIQRIAWSMITLLIIASFLFVKSGEYPMTRYSKGFEQWVAHSLDAQEINKWRKSLVLPTTRPSAASFLFPAEKYDQRVGIDVPQSLWCLAVLRAKPDAIEMLPNGAIVMAWDARGLGWVHEVYIGDSGTNIPPGLQPWYVTWRTIRPGIEVGVADHD